MSDCGGSLALASPMNVRIYGFYQPKRVVGLLAREPVGKASEGASALLPIGCLGCPGPCRSEAALSR